MLRANQRIELTNQIAVDIWPLSLWVVREKENPRWVANAFDDADWCMCARPHYNVETPNESLI